jgi:hypothetical protein
MVSAARAPKVKMNVKTKVKVANAEPQVSLVSPVSAQG